MYSPTRQPTNPPCASHDIDVAPGFRPLAHVERELKMFVFLEAIAVFFVSVDDGVVGVAEVAAHACDVTRKRREPRTDKAHVRATANDLVDHAEIVRVDVRQVRQICEIVEEAHAAGEVFLERCEEGHVPLVRGDVRQGIPRQVLLIVLQNLLAGDLHHLVLELASIHIHSAYNQIPSVNPFKQKQRSRKKKHHSIQQKLTPSIPQHKQNKNFKADQKTKSILNVTCGYGTRRRIHCLPAATGR